MSLAVSSFPSTGASKHLNASQLSAINKVGDVMIPGAQGFPRFSDAGVVSQVDRLLDHMPEGDRNDLKLLLTILAYLPRPFVAVLLHFLEWAPRIPAPLGPTLRLIRLGLRGIIMSLYFADARVHQTLGYQVSVYTDDMPIRPPTT
jgi:hypothetical protein